MNTVKEINKQSKRRAIGAIIFSAVIVILCFVGVTMRLFDTSELTGNEGLASYRMFTVDSNILVALCALLCIPYQIQGIINKNFHLPKWIVYVMYIGTTAVCMTFIVAVAILSPVAGFIEILFTKSNLFLHLLCPILSIFLFIFVAHDRKIAFSYSLLAIIPIVIYAIVYIVMVFAIGKENGGWSDHYRFNEFIPWPLTTLLMISIAFGIAIGIRAAHNKVHKTNKEKVRNEYLECEELKALSADDAVRVIAREDRKFYKKDRNIQVPSRLINLFKENKETNFSVNELSNIYIDEYLKQEQN